MDNTHKKITKQGYIISYGQRVGRDDIKGSIKVEGDSHPWPFVRSQTDPEIQELLKDEEKWPYTLVYFEVLEGTHRTTHIRLTNTPNNKKNPLFDFAYFGPNFEEEVLASLAKLALPERWHYSNEKEGQYSILDHYLKYTYLRLKVEKKIREQNEEKTEGQMESYALFNTGLVDKDYNDIYALFIPNRNKGQQRWFFKSFCTKNDKYLTWLVPSAEWPGRANFFDNPAQLIFEYDTKQEKPKDVTRIDWNHILYDHLERLPKEFILGCIDDEKEKTYNEILYSNSKERKYFFEETSLGSKTKEKLITQGNKAVEEALVKVAWNYKTAIPIWYPKKNIIALLLPLCLQDKNSPPDVALVLEKCHPSRNYGGNTILTLDMAYADARLIARPESEWLSLPIIPATEDKDAD